MYIKKLLNEKAKGLMGDAPQNLKIQTEEFIKVTSEAVNKYISEADEKVELAQAKSVKIEPGVGERYLMKPKKAGSVGSYDTLFRASDPERVLYCKYAKQAPEQSLFCSAACSGFEKLENGGVRLCNGRIVNIVEE